MPKLVLLSDTHGQRPKVPDGDILVHAGDLTMRGRPPQIAEAGEWLRSLPHKHKVVVAGNHDFLFERDPVAAKAVLGPDLIYLEDSEVVVEGLRFWGSPITPWFHDWAFNRQRGAEICLHWDRIPKGLDVLITHGPPLGVRDQICPEHFDSSHLGCEDLGEAVGRAAPRVHVFGHIHGGYGARTIGTTQFFNASVVDEEYQISNQPFVITLEVK